jgi:hypothetical protein
MLITRQYVLCQFFLWIKNGTYGLGRSKGDSVFNATSIKPLTCSKQALNALGIVELKAFGPYENIESTVLNNKKATHDMTPQK